MKLNVCGLLDEISEPRTDQDSECVQRRNQSATLTQINPVRSLGETYLSEIFDVVQERAQIGFNIHFCQILLWKLGQISIDEVQDDRLTGVLATGAGEDAELSCMNFDMSAVNFKCSMNF